MFHRLYIHAYSYIDRFFFLYDDYTVTDSLQPSIHTGHLDLPAMEMRVHYLLVEQVELSAELMMLIMLLLLNVVAVVPVSSKFMAACLSLSSAVHVVFIALYTLI